MKKLDTDTKDLILMMLIWSGIFFPAYFLWYDFRNFTICFAEASTVIIPPFKPTYYYCNLEDTNRIWDVMK